MNQFSHFALFKSASKGEINEPISAFLACLRSDFFAPRHFGFMQTNQAECTRFTFNVALELKVHPRVRGWWLLYFRVRELMAPIFQSESPLFQSERELPIKVGFSPLLVGKSSYSRHHPSFDRISLKLEWEDQIHSFPPKKAWVRASDT